MRRRLFLFALLLFGPCVVAGQNEPAADQAEQIKALLSRVELLEKEVAALKANQVVATTAPAPPVTSQASPPPASEPSNPSLELLPPAKAIGPGHAQESQVTQEAMREMEVHYPSLQFHGFGDVDFAATDQKGTTSGFYLGQLDFHIASALSRKISYFTEITLNAHPADYTIEVERSFIRYAYDDYFKISFGRFHTPISYWNTAFHHGAWLETTVDRPFQVKVGGTFTPLHFVGALAEGNIPSGPVGLGYNIGVGNGRGSVISRPGDAGDINNNRSWVVKLFSRPVKANGLELGGSFYRDKITLPTGPEYREWIANAYLVWTKGAPEFLTEFFNVNHRNIQTNAVANSDAMYAQFAYRLPWFERTLKPYYRFEYTHMPLSEQVFTHEPQVESIVGLRYDISTFAAFKVEYRYMASTPAQGGNPAIPAINGIFFQTAFTF
jgi:hypothetical protein